MDEIKFLLEQQGKAFEEFKQANDARLDEIEQKGAASPLLLEKIAKINERLDTLASESKRVSDLTDIVDRLDVLEKTASRPEYPGVMSAEQKAYKEAFMPWLRKGDTSGIDGLQTKDWQMGVSADGGYALPEELDREILKLMKNQSPMRQVCNVVSIGGVEYRKLVDTGGTSSGWVGETDPRPKTNTSKFAELRPVMGEVYANPAVSQQALDDMFFDAEAWLEQDVAEEFAKQEEAAFISGDGTNKPKGILAYPSAATADGTRPFGTLQILSAAAAGTIVPDELITVAQALKSGHRLNARWMMNRATVGKIRMLKATDGHYLWQPGLQLGQPATLLGYPVAENDDMPDVGAGTAASAILFGDFNRGYTIVDRMGIRVLRDPYTNKPFVHFYTTKRVGGMLTDSEAIKIFAV